MFELTRSSIRGGLLGSLLLSLGGVIGISALLEYRVADRPIHAAFDHALRDDAHALAAYVRVDGSRVQLDMPPGAEQVLRTDPGDAFYFLVLGPGGEYLGGEADLGVASAGDALHESAFEADYRGQPIRGIGHVHPTAAGPVTIYVAETKRARARLNRELATAILVSNGVLLLITLGLVYGLVGVGLRPLLRLSREIDARGSELLAPVSGQGLPEELQPLAGALNRLLGVIDTSSRAQRRFLADASHQLRTPLAGLQGQLELLSHEQLPEAVHARVRDLHEATRRLSHLSSRLLALGRSDALADPPLAMEAGDLAELVEACAPVFLDRAIEKKIDLGFEPGSAPVIGSAWMLREMAGNLIDNAITYTPAGGRITVRSAVRESCPVLEVEDDGPGIAPAERQRVFDRFYRGSHAGQGIGCGLGLAIVRQIAQAHGAAVSILDPDGGAGTLVRVSFPARAAAATDAGG